MVSGDKREVFRYASSMKLSVGILSSVIGLFAFGTSLLAKELAADVLPLLLLLDLCRGRDAGEPLELGSLLRGLPLTLAIPARRRIRIRTPSDAVPVPGRAARLERVFQNLVENALSLSPSVSVVDVELSLKTAAGHRCAVARVLDRGPGVLHARGVVQATVGLSMAL